MDKSNAPEKVERDRRINELSHALAVFFEKVDAPPDEAREACLALYAGSMAVDAKSDTDIALDAAECISFWVQTYRMAKCNA